MNRHIIYHGGCTDGFGAAYMVSRCWHAMGVLEDEIILHPMAHGDEPPTIPIGEPLWMVDFANVPLDWMTTHFTTRREMVVLDHHQTATRIFGDSMYRLRSSLAPPSLWTTFADPSVFSNMKLFVLDQDHSGVGIAAMYAESLGLNPGHLLPIWPQLEDRDLWRFELPSTVDVFAAVTSRPFTMAAWHEIAEMERGELIAEGQAISRYREQLVEDALSKEFLLFIDDHTIPCAASPYAVGSDVAGALAERSEKGIGAYAIYVGDQVQIGLRSRGDDAPDVAEIAERHGGGGHRNASGFRMAADMFGVLTAAV